MKLIRASRRQIVRAIRAACLALFFAATAQQAAEAQSHSGDFTVNGSTVNVAGSVIDELDAYFFDTSANGYAVTIHSGAILGDSGPEYDGNILTFDHGSVTNSGSLSGYHNGIVIANTGIVTNKSAGSINGYYTGITIEGQGTVVNSGSISNDSTNNQVYAVTFFDGGTVTNQGSGTISGTYGGVYITGGYGTVTNGKNASISASYYGVNVYGDGTVTNKGSITAIGSEDGYGINVQDVATVTNSGTITVYDHEYAYGIWVGSGTVTNTGTVSAYDSYSNYGVFLETGGDVVNSGTISAYEKGGPSPGANYGIYNGGSGTVTNLANGFIGAFSSEDYNYAVYFNGDGTINNAGHIIAAESDSGSYGVYVSGVAHITNSGYIGAFEGFQNYGVHIGGSGSVYSTVVNTASGLILAEDDYTGIGVYVGGLSHVINSGDIYGDTIGVILSGNNSSLFTNGGVIAGEENSVALTGSNSTVEVLGRTEMNGLIYGNDTTQNNTLILHLVGMTPAEAANANSNNDSSGGGEFSTTGDGGGLTYDYAWANFANVIVKAISLEEVVDSGLKPIATRIDNEGLPLAFDSFYDAAFTNPEAALNSLTGREFLNAVGQVGLSEATAFSELADSRAFNLRLGANGFDFSGLNLQSGSLMASLGSTENILTRISPDSIFGGATMSDSKDDKAMTPVEPKNPWGAWISGTLTLGDESSSASTPGFTVTAGSPTIGADYRLMPDLVVGALLNFTDSDAKFGDGSRLHNEAEMFGVYADWAKGPWFIDGLAGIGLSSYDQRRVTLSNTGVGEAVASPDGYEVVGSVNAGYDFKFGGLMVSPEVGLLYTHLTRDAYGETNAADYDLTVGRQDIDSLRTKLGVQATYPFTWDKIKFTPNVHASWYHECLDDTEGVETSLAGATDFGSFTVRTNPEGRDFAVAGVGLEVTPEELHHDITFFLNYDAQAGQNDYVAHSIDGGLRVGF